MKSWPKHCDYLGAYLMLALALLWATRLDLGVIIEKAQARKAELDAECKK